MAAGWAAYPHGVAPQVHKCPGWRSIRGSDRCQQCSWFSSHRQVTLFRVVALGLTRIRSSIAKHSAQYHSTTRLRRCELWFRLLLELLVWGCTADAAGGGSSSPTTAPWTRWSLLMATAYGGGCSVPVGGAGAEGAVRVSAPWPSWGAAVAV